jgi:hypothetical protein
MFLTYFSFACIFELFFSKLIYFYNNYDIEGIGAGDIYILSL